MLLFLPNLVNIVAVNCHNIHFFPSTCGTSLRFFLSSDLLHFNDFLYKIPTKANFTFSSCTESRSRPVKATHGCTKSRQGLTRAANKCFFSFPAAFTKYCKAACNAQYNQVYRACPSRCEKWTRRMPWNSKIRTGGLEHGTHAYVKEEKLLE